MAYRITGPAKTVIGAGALAAAEADIRALGKKALLVTGKIVEKSAAMASLTGALTSWGVAYTVFSGITGEPTDAMIAEGVAAYRAAGCDCIAALGGGSPLDSAKAISAMTVLPGEIASYMGKEIEGDFPPVALLPTTAGTGSEATKFTIITDAARDVKMLLKGDALLPRLAIVDYTYTFSAPKGVTAATGMDALTHAAEAYTSRRANPVTDLYALSAVKKIFTYLPRAYRDGNDAEAREAMALASYEAGLCINNSSVTIVHGMSRPIGALFHVPHGLSNAMLIKDCLAFAIPGCPAKFADMARAIGAASPGEDDAAAAGKFPEALGSLCRELEIPTLAGYGIGRQAFLAAAPKMAQDALASGSPGNTVRGVTREDILELYGKLV